jgi:hypothetical protein
MIVCVKRLSTLYNANDDKQLAEMLRRKLRDDRHPDLAAEVRENILPRRPFLLSVLTNF